MSDFLNYYRDIIVSPHNPISLDLGLDIEKIRDTIRNHFQWKGLIVFMPNAYYAKKLVPQAIEISLNQIPKEDFIFCPFKGICVLGTREAPAPIYLGSGGVVYADRNSFSLNGSESQYECGTMNIPLIIRLGMICNQAKIE